jgi:hypothetical protein
MANYAGVTPKAMVHDSKELNELFDSYEVPIKESESK